MRRWITAAQGAHPATQGARCWPRSGRWCRRRYGRSWSRSTGPTARGRRRSPTPSSARRPTARWSARRSTTSTTRGRSGTPRAGPARRCGSGASTTRRYAASCSTRGAAGPGAAYRRRWHDLATDAYVDETPDTVPEHGVLVVDGVFAQRPELDGIWDLVVYVDAPAGRADDPDGGSRRRPRRRRAPRPAALPRRAADLPRSLSSSGAGGRRHRQRGSRTSSPRYRSLHATMCGCPPPGPWMTPSVACATATAMRSVSCTAPSSPPCSGT